MHSTRATMDMGYTLDQVSPAKLRTLLCIRTDSNGDVLSGYGKGILAVCKGR